VRFLPDLGLLPDDPFGFQLMRRNTILHQREAKWAIGENSRERKNRTGRKQAKQKKAITHHARGAPGSWEAQSVASPMEGPAGTTHAPIFLGIGLVASVDGAVRSGGATAERPSDLD
jgi:hypothetical protein